MTRINCVPVQELSRQHLIAEYRELPRLFNLVAKAIKRGSKPDLKEVPTYRLGRGHVRFFYPRMGYIFSRYGLLIAEMTRRGYKVNYGVPEVFWGIGPEWLGDWEPDQIAIDLNRKRIEERNAEAGVRAG